MVIKNVLIKNLFVVITILALAACATQVAQTPATTAVPITGSTQAPAAAAATLPSTAAQSPTFEGLSTGLDNTKLARIRTISEVMGATNTDVYVNGMPAFNGGIAQQDIGAGQFSGWLYVTPGTYTIALVPHGGAMDQALIAAADVKVEAGHRYTVAAMGQLADKDIHPLIVDETQLEGRH